MALTEDQRETLKFLATTHRALHKDRMARTFRMVVTALTFYTVAAAAALSPQKPFPNSPTFDYVVWGFFLAVAGFVAWDSFASGRANEWNRQAAQAAEDSLMADLGTLYKKPTPAAPRRYAWIWEIVIVFVGAVVAASIITWPK